MNILKRAIGPSCVVVLFVLFGALAFAAGAGSTARADLQAALTAAKKWQADAVLTGVSGSSVAADGKAARWDYMFHSPKSKQARSITLAGGKVADELDVRPHMTDAIGADFVDSDKVMTVAKANGADTKGQPFTLSLQVMGQMTKKPGSYWSVGGGFTSGAVIVVVDAKTGQFAYKQVVP